MQRRYFIGLMGLLALPFRLLAANRQATPSQTEGPFYPVVPIPLRSNLIRDQNNLVGEAILLDGQVLDRQGNPMVNAKVEIWQCDGKGLYAHPAQYDNQSHDPNFAGFGAQLTDQQGYYSFTTLYPVPYTGRPPHIHVKIFDDDRERLTTQLYLQGNTGSSWFKSQRESLQINPLRESSGRIKAEFTFVI